MLVQRTTQEQELGVLLKHSWMVLLLTKRTSSHWDLSSGRCSCWRFLIPTPFSISLYQSHLIVAMLDMKKILVSYWWLLWNRFWIYSNIYPVFMRPKPFQINYISWAFLCECWIAWFFILHRLEKLRTTSSTGEIKNRCFPILNLLLTTQSLLRAPAVLPLRHKITWNHSFTIMFHSLISSTIT